MDRSVGFLYGNNEPKIISKFNSNDESAREEYFKHSVEKK